MRKVLLNAYTFDDLSEEYKVAERESIRYSLIDVTNLSFEIEQLTNELRGLGFYEVEISYSLTYSQGDGASFTAKISEENACKILELPTTGNDDGVIILKRLPSGYVHENTVDCDGEAPDSVLEALETWRYKKCKDMYQSLVGAYEEYTSDDAIQDWIDSNEPEYIILNGKPVQLDVSE